MVKLSWYFFNRNQALHLFEVAAWALFMLQGEVYIAQGEPIIAAAVVETFTSHCADGAASASGILLWREKSEGINNIRLLSSFHICSSKLCSKNMKLSFPGRYKGKYKRRYKGGYKGRYKGAMKKVSTSTRWIRTAQSFGILWASSAIQVSLVGRVTPAKCQENLIKYDKNR